MHFYFHRTCSGRTSRERSPQPRKHLVCANILYFPQQQPELMAAQWPVCVCCVADITKPACTPRARISYTRHSTCTRTRSHTDKLHLMFCQHLMSKLYVWVCVCYSMCGYMYMYGCRCIFSRVDGELKNKKCARPHARPPQCTVGHQRQHFTNSASPRIPAEFIEMVMWWRRCWCGVVYTRHWPCKVSAFYNRLHLLPFPHTIHGRNSPAASKNIHFV